MTADQLLRAALRMQPDDNSRRAAGRGALYFPKRHQHQPERTRVQLFMLARQANLGIAYSELKGLVRDMAYQFVQVGRTPDPVVDGVVMKPVKRGADDSVRLVRLPMPPNGKADFLIGGRQSGQAHPPVSRGSTRRSAGGENRAHFGCACQRRR